MIYEYKNILGHNIFNINLNWKSSKEHTVGDIIKINLVEYKILEIKKDKKTNIIIVEPIF
jgi:hypothetical protein